MTQPRILQATGGHTIEVHGAHLISPKLFDITAMLFTAGEYFGGYHIAKVIFTDDVIAPTAEKPEGRYASYTEEDKSVLIGLRKHFLAACRNIQAEDDVNAKYLALRAGLWFDLLTSMLHEGFHAVVWDTAREHCIAAQTDMVRLQEIEDDCTHNASLLLMDLFRDFDIEPPTIAEEPYFGTRFMEFFVQQIQNGQADWAVRQEIMVESDIIYYDDEDKDGIRTMRNWLRLTKEGDPDMNDERWDATPKKIPAAHVNPAVMVASVETPKEVALRPDTQIMVVGQNAQSVAEKVAEVAKADPSAQVIVSSGFGLLMSEDDLLEEVKNSIGHMEGHVEPDENPSEEAIEEPIEIPVAKPVVEQQALPLVEPKAELKPIHCTQCGAKIIEGAKFCMHCAAPVATQNANLPITKAEPEKTPPLFGTLPASPVKTATPETTAQTQFIGGAGGQAPATTQPVSTGGRQFTQSLRTGLPNIGMDVGTMKTILGEVYMRMHNHIFDKCGFQVCGAGTGNSVGFNPAMIGNVLQPISIADIPRAGEFIIAYDKYDPATGKTMMKVPVVNGLIAGKVSKTNHMPFYAIYINNNGTECKRILMAQNPFKQTSNGYSATSVKAQQGNKISWVWDGADGQQYRKWYHKIENGIAEWL